MEIGPGEGGDGADGHEGHEQVHEHTHQRPARQAAYQIIGHRVLVRMNMPGDPRPKSGDAQKQGEHHPSTVGADKSLKEIDQIRLPQIQRHRNGHSRPLGHVE